MFLFVKMLFLEGNCFSDLFLFCFQENWWW